MSKLLAIALALLATTAGVAVAAPPGGSGPTGPVANETGGGPGAAGGAAPTGGSAAPAGAGAAANGTPGAASAGASPAADAGPPADLPGPVPDFVGTIHDLVRDHVNGSLSGDGLGAALADLLGGGQSDGAPDATPTPDAATPTPGTGSDGAAA